LRFRLLHCGTDFLFFGLYEITSLTLLYGAPPNVNCCQYRSRSCLVVGSTARKGRFPLRAASALLPNGISTITGGLVGHWAQRGAAPSTPS
jgi:hypothetical protein